LLPHLLEDHPGLDDLLLELAQAAQRCRSSVETRLRGQLGLRRTDTGGSISRPALENLPLPLWPFALALAHRAADVAYPPSAVACQELQRQIGSSTRVGVDCGGGWRWQGQGDRVTLSKPQPSRPGFAYTVEAPGECEIPELALRFRIRRGAVEAWMFRPSSGRAGLDLPIRPGDYVIVRSRREGDRIRPFGSQYTRRLKDVLIDRRVPRQDRGSIPILEVDSRLAWIPGVTIDDAFRVEPGGQVWIAELESI
jgi:tRNA(Ile)-lysidine synthetase-like protein